MVREEEEDEESRSVPVCHHLSLLLDFIHLVQSVGVWPPQSISSISRCLRLVSSGRRLLISLHGVRVRHEPFSYCHTLRLQPALEKHFQWTSSLSSVVHQPTIPPYLTSTMIKTLLTTLHHRIVHY